MELEYYINKYCFYSAFSKKNALNLTIEQAYSVFRRFMQAKFAYNDSILSSSQFLKASAVSKNETCFKSGQNCLENNHLTTSRSISANSLKKMGTAGRMWDALTFPRHQRLENRKKE